MVIKQLIDEHLPSYLAVRRAQNNPVPWVAQRILERSTTCSDPANGSAIVGCRRCGHKHEVLFSCKCPIFCDRCARRRVNERTDHLVNSVLADVPVRHWGFNLPAELRFSIIYHRNISAGLRRKCVQGLITFLRAQARKTLGLTHVRFAFPAVLSFIHLASGHLKPNVHYHFVVPAGVWVQLKPGGPVTFHELPPPTENELAAIGLRICRLARKLMIRNGCWENLVVKAPRDAVQGILTLGERQRVTWFGAAAVPGGARRAGAQPFEIHVGNHIERGDHDGLKRLLDYLLSPPVSDDQLAFTPDGNVRLRYPRPRLGGMAEEIMHPHEMLRRLISLVPTPRSRQLEYHGAFAPRSSVRKHIVKQTKFTPRGKFSPEPDQSPEGHRARRALHHRTFYENVARCPECGERMQLIFLMTQRFTYKNPAWIKPDDPRGPAAEPAQPETRPFPSPIDRSHPDPIRP